VRATVLVSESTDKCNVGLVDFCVRCALIYAVPGVLIKVTPGVARLQRTEQTAEQHGDEQSFLTSSDPDSAMEK